MPSRTCIWLRLLGSIANLSLWHIWILHICRRCQREWSVVTLERTLLFWTRSGNWKRIGRLNQPGKKIQYCKIHAVWLMELGLLLPSQKVVFLRSVTLLAVTARYRNTIRKCYYCVTTRPAGKKYKERLWSEMSRVGNLATIGKCPRLPYFQPSWDPVSQLFCHDWQ